MKRGRTSGFVFRVSRMAPQPTWDEIFPLTRGPTRGYRALESERRRLDYITGERGDIGVESRSPPPASRRLRLAGRSLPGQQQLLAQAHKPPRAYSRTRETVTDDYIRIEIAYTVLFNPMCYATGKYFFLFRYFL